MSDPTLRALVDEPDPAFKAGLEEALDGLDDPEALTSFLVRNPVVFERLTTRMATLDDVAAFAEDDGPAVAQYLRVLWTAVEVATGTLPPVSQAVTMDTSVQWVATDSPVTFHAESDPDPASGGVSGGPGELPGAEITFEGPTGVLFAMLGDDEFDPVAAFMAEQYTVDGPLERAQAFAEMMDAVVAQMRSVSR